MPRNRNAWAEVFPSAPTCRNSICAVTFPKTVRKSNPANVPCASGSSVWITDPPVRDRRCRTPTNRWSRIVNNTRSRLGTRMRAGRWGLTDTGDGGAILVSMQIHARSGQITQGCSQRYCCNQEITLRTRTHSNVDTLGGCQLRDVLDTFALGSVGQYMFRSEAPRFLSWHASHRCRTFGGSKQRTGG